ncbi:PorT family protein [Belliella sp. DSM 111904]|uniref:PorT family protein n=1 Tax=Belliella filtrata TaxID=2923435 RepID=A0ABS9UYH5_9BACT|nr:outer membrane beta-barrel protein [Belliella filtrata]MCH7408790.1 PorT family protein [Belliella filtrata]
MKEQFDKKLVDKIKDSFENHQEKFDPQEWDKFSNAYFGGGQKKSPMMWWPWVSGIAAAIVLGFFLFIQLSDQEIQENSFMAMEEYPISKQSENHRDYQLPKEEQVLDQSRKDEFKEDKGIENLSEDKLNHVGSKLSQIIGKKENSNSIPESIQMDSNTVSNTKVSEESFRKDTSIEEAKIDSGEKLVATVLPSKEDIVEKDTFSTKQSELLKDTFIANIAEEQKEAQSSINAWLSEGVDEKLLAKSADIEKNNPMRLGVMLAPQSISNANQSLNLGAGVLSEFSFSKRLKIDVGLAYARQNISPVVNDNVIAASGSMAQHADNSRMLSFSSNFVNASYELSFGQLELPINLKYKVLESNNTGIYLITGVSNMVYLNQRNVGTFTSANFMTAGLMADSQVVAQTFVETTTPSDVALESESNIGQMVNFSLGYEYNLKNGTFISLEPFYKMSVGGQTFVNQQFAIGGLNLRMNFQFKK